MIDIADLYPDLDRLVEVQRNAFIGAPPKQRGPLADELGIFCRAAGIAALLMELDSERYYHMLTRGARARIYLLKTTAEPEKLESRFCKIGRRNGLLDALAANRIDLAQEIVAFSPTSRNTRYEYEDDYAYSKFLHEMMYPDRGWAEKQEALKCFEVSLAGQKSPRYAVCEALVQKDGRVFGDAFEEMLDAWEDEIEALANSCNRHEVEFATARYIFVEGLAMLRIADYLGIATETEYRYCPKEARRAMKVSFTDEKFPL